jgi:hypothetical protein
VEAMVSGEGGVGGLSAHAHSTTLCRSKPRARLGFVAGAVRTRYAQASKTTDSRGEKCWGGNEGIRA